ncbi:protein kinase domain-containing protein [Sediminibacillus massiliensis]|uniref:protein kinase domain-containing protein n=1 Tax=Sediminibacillus massiliensis TaxID=1926277 RepID=UPI00098888DE|nr:serine/threonine-protein kinase [Sediminibacillus massiliensis]
MKTNQTSKKHSFDLKPGTLISGKWHNNRYMIIKLLGRGAIGAVYLCEHNGRRSALKISDKGSSVTMEVNVLKSFQKVQGNDHLGPSLLDVDDWVLPGGQRYSFYVMEYVHGQPLSTFIRTSGQEWLGILLLQLLDDLEKLHKTGWVFGDLKTENLIVASHPPRLRWIDVGGTTQIGRSIKEYTEFYDRGYWQMGSRKAEPSYDLFALVMVILQIYYPTRFDKGTSPEKTLIDRIKSTPQLEKYASWMKKGLYGKYTSSGEMRRELSALLMDKPKTSVNSAPASRTANRKAQQKNKSHPVMETVCILAVVMLFYFFYLLFA